MFISKCGALVSSYYSDRINYKYTLFYIPGECQDAHFEVSLWSNRISESLGSAVIFTPTSLLKEHKFHEEPHAITEDTSKVPRWLEDLMAHCLPLMNCNVRGLQFAAYHILSRYVNFLFPYRANPLYRSNNL